jgi:hypothetical protein
MGDDARSWGRSSGRLVHAGELLDDDTDVGRLDVAAVELDGTGFLESSWIEMVGNIRCARDRRGQGGRETEERVGVVSNVASVHQLSDCRREFRLGSLVGRGRNEQGGLALMFLRWRGE